jgi:hypothetical protein
LHVFHVDGVAPHELGRGRDKERPLRRVLGRILGVGAEDVPLERDVLGRLGLARGPLGLAVCADEGRLTVALARCRSLALSLHRVPRAPDGMFRLPFSEAERRWADAAPAGGVMTRLACMWTRKEAALRLVGSPLSAAAELDVVTGGRGSEVILSRPVRGAWPAPAGTPDVAYVRDLDAGSGLVAAVATSAPVARARTWRLDWAECAEAEGASSTAGRPWAAALPDVTREAGGAVAPHASLGRPVRAVRPDRAAGLVSGGDDHLCGAGPGDAGDRRRLRGHGHGGA